MKIHPHEIIGKKCDFHILSLTYFLEVDKESHPKIIEYQNVYICLFW